jgi:hypothetical protein
VTLSANTRITPAEPEGAAVLAVIVTAELPAPRKCTDLEIEVTRPDWPQVKEPAGMSIVSPDEAASASAAFTSACEPSVV